MSKQKWLTTWVPHRLEMLVSPAWRARPIAVMRIIERLEEEHLRHGGTQNGKLYVSFLQFQSAGVSKRVIKPALECAAALGLVEIVKEGEARGDVRPPNAYRLTFLPVGKAIPTDEWKRVKAEKAEAVATVFRAATKRKEKQDEAEAAA